MTSRQRKATNENNLILKIGLSKYNIHSYLCQTNFIIQFSNNGCFTFSSEKLAQQPRDKKSYPTCQQHLVNVNVIAHMFTVKK